MSQSPDFPKHQIEAAHNRIKPYIHNTPILTSQSINEMVGAELFFKCENFQKIGAFKMRGATNAILQLSETEKKNGVVTHSSGNHAQAVALAAKLNKLQAYIVMPETAPKVKVAAVEEYGGIISFCEANPQARDKAAQKIIEQTGATFIHPFDNEKVILGQASCAKEILEKIPQLNTLICPVGGGGLLAGTILSANHFGKNIQVYAGEPEGADDAYRSIKNRQLEKNSSVNTIADGLLTHLGELNFSIIKDGVREILLVNDNEIKAAMKIIWERMKIIIEPSCAVPFAAILKEKEKFKNKKIGVILTGGNVDLKTVSSLF